MKYLATLFLLFFLYSCKNKEKFHYETSIASKVYEAEIKLLNYRIYDYSKNFDNAGNLLGLNNELDKLIDSSQDVLSKEHAVNASRLKQRLTKFDSLFTSKFGHEKSVINEFMSLGITTQSDLDQIRLYIKMNLVNLMYFSKIHPYNSYSILLSAPRTIKYGEEFEVEMAHTLWNRYNPDQWWIITSQADPDSPDVIIDTVKPDKMGFFRYKTKNYKRGENEIVFKTTSTAGYDRTFKRTISFTVN
jgi:hypothetical protein